MLFQKKDKGINPKERAMWGDLMAMGMVFPLSIVLGFFIGRWLGGLLGHPTGGQWVGLVWGIATGFWELYKVTMRMNGLDDGSKDKGGPEGRGDGHDDPRA